MKVARSRALHRRQLNVLIPIGTKIQNKLETSILNLISGACLCKYVVSYRLSAPEGCATSHRPGDLLR